MLAFVAELDRSSAFLRAVKELQHRSTALKLILHHQSVEQFLQAAQSADVFC